MGPKDQSHAGWPGLPHWSHVATLEKPTRVRRPGGRHVPLRRRRAAREGQPWGSLQGNLASRSARSCGIAGGVGHAEHQAEVAEVRVEVGVEEDVGGLDIPVNDGGRGVVERSRHLAVCSARRMRRGQPGGRGSEWSRSCGHGRVRLAGEVPHSSRAVMSAGRGKARLGGDPKIAWLASAWL